MNLGALESLSLVLLETKEMNVITTADGKYIFKVELLNSFPLERKIMRILLKKQFSLEKLPEVFAIYCFLSFSIFYIRIFSHESNIIVSLRLCLIRVKFGKWKEN